jgi:hypothetical protein
MFLFLSTDGSVCEMLFPTPQRSVPDLHYSMLWASLGGSQPLKTAFLRPALTSSQTR